MLVTFGVLSDFSIEAVTNAIIFKFVLKYLLMLQLNVHAIE
jgi:hypothetical protein